MGRRVVWAALMAAVLGVPSVAAAQDRQISGTVSRQSGGQPIAEATVAAVGGRGAARTNSEGKFTITVGPGDVRLAVRAIGYQRREVVVPAGQSSVNVSLTEDIFKLEEVVVTGQATTLEKRNATTATATVSADEVTNAPAKDLTQALQGKVLGTTINLNGGQPGGGGQIQVRGVTSILGSGQPLFVVDGVIISNDGFSSGANAITAAANRTTAGGIGSNQDAVVNRLADINPNEIESIEVLKSAAATAIYGSRATNGVVIIKTKRGKPGQTRFNLTQRVGVSEPLRLIGSRVWTSVDTLLNGNLFGTPSCTGACAAYVAAKYPSGVIPASDNVDLQEQFFSNRKPAYETIGSMSGGTETLQYFLSAGNRQEVGTAPRTGARLQTIRANVDQAWNSKFKTSFSFNATRNVLNRGLSNNDNTFTSPIYNFGYAPSFLPLNTRDSLGNYFRNPIFGGGNATSNPFETFNFLDITEDVFRQTGAVTQFYTPVSTATSTLSFSVVAGFDHFNQQSKVVSPAFLQYEGNDGFFGRIANTNVEALNYNFQPNVTWNYSGLKGTTFTTSAGFSYERQGTNLYRVRGRGILPGITNVQQARSIDAASDINEFRDQALFANEQILTANNRLALNFGIRADRSSANGDPGKYYIFPRASGSYNFDKPFSGVDNIKIRGGYGETGNRPIFGSRDILLPSPGTISGQSAIVTAGTVGNPAIRPETLKEWEGGLDATLFNSRVQIEGTYYSRKLTNQLLQPAVAPSSGVGALFLNAGRLRNEGFEGGITFVPVNSSDLQWTSRATFQKNKQRVLDLPANVPPFAAPNSFGATFGRNRITPGGLTTAIWGNAPVDRNTREILPIGCQLDPACAANAIQIDTIVGDANPKFQMFFNNSVTYKRVTLAATVDWRKGGDVSNMTQTGLFDDGANSKDFTDPTTPKNSRASAATIAAAIARDPAYGQIGNFRADLYYRDARIVVQDGGFVRLRDISLSYDAPTTIARSVGARSLRVTAQGRNLFLWTKYAGYDPEFNNFGNQNLNRFIDLAPFPGNRQFYLSVDVGF